MEKIIRLEKLKLPENRKPSVIDKNIVWQAIGVGDQIVPAPGAVSPTEDEKKNTANAIKSQRDYITSTVKTLKLEFQQILKIDNLNPLVSLTRLFMDNNFIERISGLDNLIHLVWLDLSFNRIQKLEGMENLKRLQVLALYQNQISKLENLDHLPHLNVLRIGKNKLSNRDDILYLRRLKRLSTLSVAGNPLCKSEGWEDYVKALLPNLICLESHNIKNRDLATARYQGDVFKAEGKEEQERIKDEAKRQEAESQLRHKAAFVESVRGQILIKELTSKNMGAEYELGRRLIKRESGAESLRAEYEAEMSRLGDEIHNLGLAEADIRQKEIRIFKEAIAAAQKFTQRDGVKAVEAFLDKKEQIFNMFYDKMGILEEREPEEVTDGQREELEHLRDDFRVKAKATWDTVMSLEMVLVTQTEQVLDLCEQSLEVMISSFLGRVRNLFQHGRNIDIRYFKRLSEIGEQMEAGTYEVMATEEQKKRKDPHHVGKDKEEANILSVIAKCHDGHQELLLAEEVKIQASVKAWASNFLIEFRNKERARSRTRVLELNHFLDSMKREEEELEVDMGEGMDEDGDL